jgi:hypothetical protein
MTVTAMWKVQVILQHWVGIPLNCKKLAKPQKKESWWLSTKEPTEIYYLTAYVNIGIPNKEGSSMPGWVQGDALSEIINQATAHHLAAIHKMNPDYYIAFKLYHIKYKSTKVDQISNKCKAIFPCTSIATPKSLTTSPMTS